MDDCILFPQEALHAKYFSSRMKITISIISPIDGCPVCQCPSIGKDGATCAEVVVNVITRDERTIENFSLDGSQIFLILAITLTPLP